MRPFERFVIGSVFVLGLMVCTDQSIGQTSTTTVDVSTSLGYDALTRGPIHEAFGVPLDLDLNDGPRFRSTAPPNPIQELPPSRPRPGEAFQWIPGYWSWCNQSNAYLWVSGLYRRTPPGRTWVSGYWSQRDRGHRWTRGYWAAERRSPDQGLARLPVPPRSRDEGPDSETPGQEFFWRPGFWEYADRDYRWSSGFWSKHREGWCWQPATHVLTPDGVVFVDGYWDHLPPERGQLYAPVSFRSTVYRQPNYVYRPATPLPHSATLLTHLFVQPECHQYYYGDYHGPTYVSIGYRPWYDAGFHAPWLSYYNWKYRRSGIDFLSTMKLFESHYHTYSGRKSTVLLSPRSRKKPVEEPKPVRGVASAIAPPLIGPSPRDERVITPGAFEDDPRVIQGSRGTQGTARDRNRRDTASARTGSRPRPGLGARTGRPQRPSNTYGSLGRGYSPGFNPQVVPSLPRANSSSSTSVVAPRLRGSTGLPRLGGSSSLPALGGSSSLPALRGSSSLPALRGSSSLPALRGSSSLPRIGGSSRVSRSPVYGRPAFSNPQVVPSLSRSRGSNVFRGGTSIYGGRSMGASVVPSLGRGR